MTGSSLPIYLLIGSATVTLAVTLARGWRPSRRVVTWAVAIVAICLTPVVVGFLFS